ncbi:MAG: aldo/keto reductase [Candidatus Hydrogenedentes bacterium]|nr:aldo/keto reductase [Candidatus Hydrogenedentota bacterium]
MRFGRVSGISKPVSTLVQGTVMLPGDEKATHALLDAVLELGCNTFDTGHEYAGGEGERAFGRWLESRGVRDRIVIVGKGCHHNADRKCVTPFDVSAHLHDSLARMKTDHIDLYMLHRDDPSQPVGPLMEALNAHMDEGKIHAIGASNWTTRRIQEANLYAQARGLTPFVASSPQFSLAEMIDEPWDNCLSISGPQGESDRAWYEENEMALFSWSSLASGFLSGKLTRQNAHQYEGKIFHRCYACEANFKRLDRLQELAKLKRVSVPQLALAWVLHHPLELYPLVAAYHPREFEQLTKALEIDVSPEESEWLDLEREDFQLGS